MKNFATTKLLPAVLLAALLLAGGCSVDDPTDVRDSVNGPAIGDAGARYMAIGNSLTAGFMDGGLMKAGQAGSFPQLIAAQLGLDSSAFTQPWIEFPGIGSSGASAGHVAGVLYWNGSSVAVVGETPLQDVQSELLLAAAQPTPYHNLGVPGATLHDGMNAYSAATSQGPSPFFDFINRASFFGNTQVQSGYPAGDSVVPVTYETASQFGQGVAKGGVLVTLWLGNNDVLGPATSGNPPPNFGAAGGPAYNAFVSDYTALLALTAGGLLQRNGIPATIVVANIPSVADAPYFVPEALFDQAVQSQLGQSWPGGYEDEDPVYVLFPALAWLQATADPGNPASFLTPIPSKYTLTAAEVGYVNEAVNNYNAVIAGVAQQIGMTGTARIGLMDANALLAGLPAAAKTHFFFLQAQIGEELAAQTTMFSLDGIHPNNLGYGVVANAFIEVINDLDGTDIPTIPVEALSWDPTYGVSGNTKAGGFGLDPAAADAMSSLFR